MSVLPGFVFHRLLQVPRPGSGERRDTPDSTAVGLQAALTASYLNLLATDDDAAAVMTAWIRTPGQRQLRFLLGGRPFFPPALAGPEDEPTPGKRRRVLFPPGAVVEDIPAGQVSSLLDEFTKWLPCTGTPDALRSPDDPDRAAGGHNGAFDRYAAHLSEPFVWLVLARPLRPSMLQPELDRLKTAIQPLKRDGGSETQRVQLLRLRGRYEELSRAPIDGFWSVQVLVGARHATTAVTVASMLCAASDLTGLPYILTPQGQPRPLSEAVTPADGGQPDGVFTGSTRLVAALTRPPQRELPGIRLVQPHTFDVTPEHADTAGLRLGAVLDEAGANVGDLIITRDSMNRHTFVCGATGTGKSQTVRHLLEQATEADIPWLVIEPAKAEYARMANRVNNVIVIRPGALDEPPAGLNPLEPAPGFSLQTHADLLRALFLASFEAQEPFPQILAAALTRCYEDLGWDLTLGHATHDGPPPRYPTLGDLQRTAEAVVDDIGYSKEISDNVRGFIKVRLASLRLGTTGRFFEGGHPVDFDELHRRNIVLEIEDIGDDASKAFFMGVILIRLVEHLRTSAGTSAGNGSKLRHLTVIEEAHRLLRRHDVTAGPVAHAVEMFAALLAEIRAYGEGLIIAEQIPSKVIPDVIKNTAVKIMHRLPAEDDRAAVGASMNLDTDQSAYMLSLPNGSGAVITDGMDHPLLIGVPDGTTREDASTPVPASVIDIIGRRSPTCAQDCRTQPCTLRQIRHSHQLLVDYPWLSLWAELATIAHLAGHLMPVPKTDVLAILPEGIRQSRTLQCALTHAVDDAVNTRSTVLQSSAPPTDLASHIHRDIRSILNGGEQRCMDDSLQYLARPYRWKVAYLALKAEPEDAGPHPQTAQWEQKFRRTLPGSSINEQRAAALSFMGSEMQNATHKHVVAFGQQQSSTIEKAVGVRHDDPSWPQRITESLHQFTHTKGVATHLAISGDHQTQG